ncbi:MAG: chloride channel protein, partial [Thermoplasmatota archaeon]
MIELAEMSPSSEEQDIKNLSCTNPDCENFKKIGKENITLIDESDTTKGVKRTYRCHTCGEYFEIHKEMDRNVSEKVKLMIYSFTSPDLARLSILGVLIGAVGGLGAFLFHHLILGFKYIFFGATDTYTFLDTVLSLPWYHRLLMPALGGLIIGPIITYFVREARGHGVPEVMECVALRGGKIRARVAPLKALMSAICIGSGGSAGREGPIVQIGASFGSSLGQFLELEPDRIKTLLAAGAAAGIAGTFNAPLAGVVFSMEVILRDIKKESLAPIVIAAVVGTGFANFLFGGRGPIFDIQSMKIGPWDVLFFIGIGFVAAGVGLLFSNSLYKMEHLFEKIPFTEAIRPALGGLMLGALALSIP